MENNSNAASCLLKQHVSLICINSKSVSQLYYFKIDYFRMVLQRYYICNAIHIHAPVNDHRK